MNRDSLLTYGVLLLVVFALASSVVFRQGAVVRPAGWWNSDWKMRYDLVIQSQNGSPLRGWQVRFVAPTKFRNRRDLRIVYDGNLIPYYFWGSYIYLRIPDRPEFEKPVVTLYAYIGNKDARSVSNRDSVYYIVNTSFEPGQFRFSDSNLEYVSSIHRTGRYSLKIPAGHCAAYDIFRSRWQYLYARFYARGSHSGTYLDVYLDSVRISSRYLGTWWSYIYVSRYFGSSGEHVLRFCARRGDVYIDDFQMYDNMMEASAVFMNPVSYFEINLSPVLVSPVDPDVSDENYSVFRLVTTSEVPPKSLDVYVDGSKVLSVSGSSAEFRVPLTAGDHDVNAIVHFDSFDVNVSEHVHVPSYPYDINVTKDCSSSRCHLVASAENASLYEWNVDGNTIAGKDVTVSADANFVVLRVCSSDNLCKVRPVSLPSVRLLSRPVSSVEVHTHVGSLTNKQVLESEHQSRSLVSSVRSGRMSVSVNPVSVSIAGALAFAIYYLVRVLIHI